MGQTPQAAVVFAEHAERLVEQVREPRQVGSRPVRPMISTRTYQYGERAGTVLTWRWEGGPHIDVYHGLDEHPFEVIDVLGRDGDPPPFTRRAFTEGISGGPSMARLIETWEASR